MLCLPVCASEKHISWQPHRMGKYRPPSSIDPRIHVYVIMTPARRQQKHLLGSPHNVLWICRLQRRFVWKPVRHLIFAGHVPQPQVKTFGQFLHEMAPQYAASPSRFRVTVMQSCGYDPAPQGILVVVFVFSLVMNMFGQLAVPPLSIAYPWHGMCSDSCWLLSTDAHGS